MEIPKWFEQYFFILQNKIYTIFNTIINYTNNQIKWKIPIRFETSTDIALLLRSKTYSQKIVGILDIYIKKNNKTFY